MEIGVHGKRQPAPEVPRPGTTTIAAIASPPGAGQRGILRVSGPRAGELVRAMWRGEAPGPDLSRRGVQAGRLADAQGEQPVLLLWMPAPHSFTREDVAELHLAGNAYLLGAALERLLELGAQPAPPGEFTRRAFLSGRIDLSRAEGVLALVSARNESERRAGLALLFGGLADRIGRLREQIEELRALCESSLDFVESETGHVPSEEIETLAARVGQDLQEALAWETRRGAPAGAPRIVLTGAPNAGKSRLFNALTGFDQALVSEHAGTTRDVLSSNFDLSGVGCRLIDTAGLNASARGPDRGAQAVARSSCASADLLLWVVDAARRSTPTLPGLIEEWTALSTDAPCVLVWNKIDIAGTAPQPSVDLLSPGGTSRSIAGWVATSAATGAGLDRLRAAAAQALGLSGAPGFTGTGPDEVPGESAGLARELSLRQRRALEETGVELERGLSEWRAGAPLELLAEHLRRATAALDQISGATTADDILDRIFARFCIGK